MDLLSSDGWLISSLDPVKNIPDYPEELFIRNHFKSIKNYLVVNAKDLALAADSIRSANMVMVGAASKKLDISKSILLDCIKDKFNSKGDKVVESNIAAFNLGRETETSLWVKTKISKNFSTPAP